MELSRLKICFEAFIKERYTHILLTGKSGTGKSALLSNWWRSDNFYHPAMILIEPAGFLSKECYSISRGKAHYCSLDTPISINPMQAPYNPSQISDNIAECINQVIKLTTANQELTVKMRDILDEAIKYCLSHNRKSLLNVLDYITNQKGNSETRDGIIYRLKFLLNDERFTKIICGNEAIKIGELIDKQEQFILDCFGMGREKMIFTGNIVSQSIKNYFRYERPKEYKPLALYVDECHNFINFNFMDILKEGRKYKLGCTLATQDLAFDDKLARVMLNVGNIVSFRLGSREAQLIANELGKVKEDEITYKIEYKGMLAIEKVDKVIKFDTKTILQTLEKYHVAFMTGEKSGMGKAPRPPFFKKIEPRPELPSKPKVEKSKWFILESYQPV
jgi:hypothetical protein